MHKRRPTKPVSFGGRSTRDKPSNPRDTYNYEYVVDGKVSHRGITNDPARRESEHQRNHPGGKVIVKGRAKTRRGAIAAERRQSRTRGYHA